MKRLKWLIDLADNKPLLFAVAILIIGISYLAVENKNCQLKINSLEFERKLTEAATNRRIDSINSYYLAREIKLNEEVKTTLNFIINDYKEQIIEQKNINDKMNSSIQDNKQMISTNRNKIKKLNR